MKAADVMTRNVLTVGPESSVAQAIRLMLNNNISGLPVLAADRKVVGILTEGDLLRRGETGTERHRPRWLEILMGPGRASRARQRSTPSWKPSARNGLTSSVCSAASASRRRVRARRPRAERRNHSPYRGSSRMPGGRSTARVVGGGA